MLEGEPIVIAQDGAWIDGNLKRERLTQDEVLEEARKQNIGSLDEVAWAILENGGAISFVKKSG